MTEEDRYMLRCIELAENGLGTTTPNPLVGAVLVYQGKIIGEGWHKKAGEPHAEVNCIASVPKEKEDLIPQSTLYVSLEPCSHFGKTPPCSDLIIRKGIRKVVVGCLDPNPKVAGNGVWKLDNAGIKVTVGVLEKECRRLNKRFLTKQEINRPYIILKWAESIDGFIDGVGSKPIMISEWRQQRAVHLERRNEDAVLVGYRTALKDNPKLTNRYWPGGVQPLRILIDKKNSLPASHFLKSEDPDQTLIFTYEPNPMEENGVKYVLLKQGESIPGQVLSQCGRINSLVVEGGRATLQSFIDEGLWDEAHRWTNQNKSIGNGVSAPQLKNGILVNSQMLGADRLDTFRAEWNEFLG